MPTRARDETDRVCKAGGGRAHSRSRRFFWNQPLYIYGRSFTTRAHQGGTQVKPDHD